MDFTTHKPVTVLTGENCVTENADVFASLGRRALVVSGRRSADLCGAMDDVAAALASVGATYVRFNVIPENPPAPLCHEGGALARQENCDFIVAIGGGSALDAAKAIAAYAANPDCDVNDIFDDSKRTADGLPIAAIPTTAGTGSEVNRYSVLTVDGGAKKKTFKASSAYPKYAFVSSKYTASLDENYTVSTALDALAHAMESYLSPKSTEVSENAALYAAREIWNILFCGMYADGERDAGGFTKVQREKLTNASCAAGIAIDYTGTGFPHPLGYSLTLTRGIPHGRACAVFAGAYLNYNLLTAAGEEKIAKLTAHLGTTAEEMARRIPEMSGLLDLKIGAEEREELIDRVAGAGNYANSPYVITRGEMSDIYARLFG